MKKKYIIIIITGKKQTIILPWIPKIGPKSKKKSKSLDLE